VGLLAALVDPAEDADMLVPDMDAKGPAVSSKQILVALNVATQIEKSQVNA
jgi:hypothetical protein